MNCVRNLVPHPNIIQLITIVPPLKASSFHSIGIIMENSTDSLYEAAKRTRFTDAHVRIIISQILSALLYLYVTTSHAVTERSHRKTLAESYVVWFTGI